MDRPPNASRSGPTWRRAASSVEADRMVSMHTAGGSGRRLPAAWLGNSMRSTAMPVAVTTSSTATSPGWSRRALLPGVRMRPAMLDAVTGASLQTAGPSARREPAALANARGSGPGERWRRTLRRMRGRPSRGALGAMADRAASASRSLDVASRTALAGESGVAGADATTPSVTLTRYVGPSEATSSQAPSPSPRKRACGRVCAR